MSAHPLVAIGDLTEPVSSWTPERDDPGGVFTYVDLSAVDQDAKVIAGARELACAEAPTRARQLVRAGDVLVSTVRPNLNGVARVPAGLNGATASTGFCVLRPKADLLDGDFLFQWVKSPNFVSEMVRRATGASYPAVSDRIVCDSRMPLPPLPVQRRIASILDKADVLRAMRRAALARLDSLTQSIFLDMFGDPATNPKGWPVAPLAEVCSVNGEYGAGVASRPYESSLPRYVRITDIADRGQLTSDAVSPAGQPTEWESYSLAPGDVLFARSGATVGKTYLHHESNGQCVFAGYLIRFRTRPDRLLPEFLFHFTRTAAYRRWVDVRQRVVAQPNINAHQYGYELCVPCPPVELQERLTERLRSVGLIEAKQSAAIAEADALLSSLQQRAFRGEL